MKIYAETGYLIVMDPAYLKVADYDQVKKTDFLKKPKEAAKKLESILFPDAFGGLIGLVKLLDGPGYYEVDLSQIDFWDVDTKGKKIIFGVDLGSFIIFDIQYIHPLVEHFDKFRFEKENQPDYLAELQQKFSDRSDVLLWAPSPLPFAEGWHEVHLTAFKKID